jgi:hypothetical protein
MDLDYIQALEREMIESGVTVPLSFNDVSRIICRLLDTSQSTFSYVAGRNEEQIG